MEAVAVETVEPVEGGAEEVGEGEKVGCELTLVLLVPICLMRPVF